MSHNNTMQADVDVTVSPEVTRKPCCHKETARCRSCSFRFKVRRQHSLQVEGCPFNSPNFNSPNSNYRVGVRVRDRVRVRVRVRDRVRRIEIRRIEKKPVEE